MKWIKREPGEGVLLGAWDSFVVLTRSARRP